MLEKMYKLNLLKKNHSEYEVFIIDQGNTRLFRKEQPFNNSKQIGKWDPTCVSNENNLNNKEFGRENTVL